MEINELKNKFSNGYFRNGRLSLKYGDYAVGKIIDIIPKVDNKSIKKINYIIYGFIDEKVHINEYTISFNSFNKYFYYPIAEVEFKHYKQMILDKVN